DEPTNHLDIDAREELLSALNDYEGSVILISHDRRLIEGCAERLLLVVDGRASPFGGDLDDYKRLGLSGYGEPEQRVRDSCPVSKADQRREAADRRLQLRPLKDEMEGWERKVVSLHSELERLDAALAAPGLFTK